MVCQHSDQMAGTLTFPSRALRERLDHCRATATFGRWLDRRLAVVPPETEDFVAPVTTISGSYEPIGFPVFGRVWELSQDAIGCREVQHALQVCDDGERLMIAAELSGRVSDAIRSPHGNHVVQRVVMLLRQQDFQFVVDELLARPLVPVAQHKFGCRVIQRLLEHGAEDQTDKLLGCLSGDILGLSKHPYGNYVVQHMFQHASERRRSEVMYGIRQHVGPLATDPYGCVVVWKVLTNGNRSERCALVEALSELHEKEPEVIASMACMRHGHAIVEHLLHEPRVARTLEAELSQRSAVLNSSRHGRRVAKLLGLVATEDDGASFGAVIGGA